MTPPPPPPLLLLPLACVCVAAALIGGARAEGACLQDGKHKATPTPEQHLGACSLYADNSCCSEENVQDVTFVPSVSSRDQTWDRCGPLSPHCESFLKRLSCFYRCSPDAARWPHPQRSSSLQQVPLCLSFCREWFDACRTDLTCARNWATDPRGQNCTGSCVQFQQMFQNDRDLCEGLWGDTFVAVEDDGVDAPPAGAGLPEGGRGCGCLTLSPSDKEVMAALRAQQDDPEELDTTKTHLPQYRPPCRTHNVMLRKRSLPVEDGEGSGSGL